MSGRGTSPYWSANPQFHCLWPALCSETHRQSSVSANPNHSEHEKRTHPSGWLNLPSQPMPSHFSAHLSLPLASNFQQPNYGSDGVNAKNHRLPKSPSFTRAVIRTNSQRAEHPVMDSVIMLKCLFVHRPLALDDSVLKALTHFSVYYCVRFFSVTAVSGILKSSKRPF